MPGVVYFLSNPSMPGLLKIGFTQDALDQRLAALRHTGIPSNFEIQAAFQVTNAAECEQAIHERLKEFRHAPNREFFRVGLKTALQRSWSVIQDFLTDETENSATADTHP